MTMRLNYKDKCLELCKKTIKLFGNNFHFVDPNYDN